MLEHGGRLQAAARKHGIPAGEWLDLSTGIAPTGYPPPALPAEAWRRLPEPEDGLLAAAEAYYGTAALTPVAGSQVAIGLLPWLRAPGLVACPAGGYAEHAAAWRRAGHSVSEYRPGGLEQAVSDADVVVVVNPDNPTGRHVPVARLRRWQASLMGRGGWLVVDEAFADVAPEVSVIGDAGSEGLVVLRSMGKFFGLAGARVGFVGAAAGVRAALDQLAGPWPVAGPARMVAAAALTDTAWQARQRRQLAAAATRLRALLADAGLAAEGGTDLYAWAPLSAPDALAAALARRAILVRRFREPQGLRIGLPPDEGAAWSRLADALPAARREAGA
ncbi:threonine-phosphate decarboxylase CobD [Sediminicurvatus halobius]|uniref:threonine-phosphate decarboxylase n=1 Tax=Sediminicurvatus halobius TaxID=2182432 RepID=A0A2U2N1Q2_9GAMM|nr:threonine-phosphate decarboxylase CobD [Spiribacter halobius]PWG63141.1 threonine-phosphate decarboxylase [Spiribacter halobius]UEX77591.1 threonine-phosphate decarboxylase CobD [Spiribacter halobius]